MDRRYVDADGVPELFLAIAQLGEDRLQGRGRLHTFQEPMSLREGMYDLLLRASRFKFPGAGLGQEGHQGGRTSLAVLQDRGAWLFTLNAAVRLLAECASGSGQGSGLKGKRSEIQVREPP